MTLANPSHFSVYNDSGVLLLPGGVKVYKRENEEAPLFDNVRIDNGHHLHGPDIEHLAGDYVFEVTTQCFPYGRVYLYVSDAQSRPEMCFADLNFTGAGTLRKEFAI